MLAERLTYRGKKVNYTEISRRSGDSMKTSSTKMVWHDRLRR